MDISTEKTDPVIQTPKSSPKSARWKWLLDQGSSLAFALILVFMVRSSLVEAFKIPSGSMIPTLFVGDHIFVNKFAFGLKVPFTEWINVKPRMLWEREGPKRGQVIVFIFPKDESLHYIKRVVGVPGDRIEIRNKVIYINGAEQKQVPIAAEKIDVSDSDPKSNYYGVRFYEETLGDTKHIVMINDESFGGYDFGPIEVPPESLFVMGDNRDHSLDSRSWGFVPYSHLRGEALFIWNSIWFDWDNFNTTFRPGRIGTVVN